MSDIVRPLIQKITTNAPYEEAEMKAAFGAIMSGDVSPALISAFLIGLKMRGETPQDITAGASTLREMADKITAPIDAIDIIHMW